MTVASKGVAAIPLSSRGANVPRPVIAALYVASVPLFALVLRWRGSAPWRQFFVGAAAICVADAVHGIVAHSLDLSLRSS